MTQARSERMAKGRVWVVVKQYKGYEAADCMFSELEALSDITEVMKDINKVSTALTIYVAGGLVSDRRRRYAID